MNLLLVLANVIGFLALAAACLKIIETGPTIGPAVSPELCACARLSPYLRPLHR